MKTYTNEEKKRLVAEFDARPDHISPRKFCQLAGVSDYSIYTWRKLFNGNGHTPKKVTENAPTGLEFNVVQDREARLWVETSRFGRFQALKESLVEQLRGLRKPNALTFSGPKDGNKKEVHSIHVATSGAIRKADLPFTVRYSKSRNLFIVLRKEVKP
jgi:hypothetical protein